MATMHKTYQLNGITHPFKYATYGELYGSAMQITDAAEATAYFELCVQYHMETWSMVRSEAETVNRQNLGYYAGYYDQETMERVQRLFLAEHPIFGPVLSREETVVIPTHRSSTWETDIEVE
jgi:hypothetical protein